MTFIRSDACNNKILTKMKYLFYLMVCTAIFFIDRPTNAFSELNLEPKLQLNLATSAGGKPISTPAATRAGTARPQIMNTITPNTIVQNNAPVNGPLNVKMGASAQSTEIYGENFSTGDDQSSFPWNTPAYWTDRDIYQGTRGINHGNPSNAGDGNGPVFDFQSWSRRGSYLDAVTLNGGLESANANNECSDLDINGYRMGSVTTMLAVDACGGGLTTTPTLFPGGDITWNLGYSTRRFNDGYFGGTVNVGILADSGNAFISGSLIGQLPYLSGWQIDTSANAGQIATGTSQPLASGRGIVIVSNSTNGDTGMYLCSGGACVLVSSIFSTFVTGTSPASGKLSVAWSGSAYSIYSNFGKTANISVGLWKIGASN